MRKYIEDESWAREFQIEPMSESDLDEVVEVESLTGLSPWGKDGYRRELSENPHAVMLVARAIHPPAADRGVIGFLCSNVVLDEWHINNVATHPEFRRRGVAWALMERGSVLARSDGARFSLLEVRETNYPAHVLYVRMGYRIVARRRCYYSQPIEDAIVLRMELAEGSGGRPG
ncbi:MAG: ribosomal protein S18-alanine N-acetyltransferase [Acidobacteria bacterium]|nr:ribosomal protein S18-alanine N-acetyltransferase [Acidobacteriota bacterium]